MNPKFVTSLSLSKRLKELGVPQDGAWMWVKYELWNEPQLWSSDINKATKLTCLSGKREYEYAAFTCGELIELLGDSFNGLDFAISLNNPFVASAWDNNDEILTAKGDTPQEALGKLALGKLLEVISHEKKKL